MTRATKPITRHPEIIELKELLDAFRNCETMLE